ncbi:MAG: hypothetical protein ACTSWQ_02340, partial [Candidatus Thorarchaeota archaeon]
MNENDGIFEDRRYMGKSMVKSGEGKKGPWKLFKLEFEKVGSKFPQKMSCFDGLGRKSGHTLKDLEEGEMYSIGYKEEEQTHPEHGAYTSRTIFWMGDVRDEGQTSEEL